MFTSGRKLILLISLSLCFLVLLGISVWLSARRDTASPTMSAASQQEAVQSERLRLSSAPPATESKEIPVWLIAVISGFTAFQMFPLIIAVRMGGRKSLSVRDRQTILFLCETPMYLGLLGSLMGVCLTQFLTGDLAAPLAYLTTIGGILLYLFAKFTIWLPLADEPPHGVHDDTEWTL